MDTSQFLSEGVVPCKTNEMSQKILLSFPSHSGMRQRRRPHLGMRQRRRPHLGMRQRRRLIRLIVSEKTETRLEHVSHIESMPDR